MNVLYSPEWLSETAAATLLAANTTFINIYISDTLAKRQWPCLTACCNSSEEVKIGRRAAFDGGYLSGVFLQKVEVAMELKADTLAAPGPSQNADANIEAAQLWMQVYQAFHQDVLLQTLLTNSVQQPYECFSAYLSDGSQSVDDEKRIWRKSLILELRAMANTG